MAYLKYKASTQIDAPKSRVLVDFSIEDVRGVPAYLLVVRRRISSLGLIEDPELMRVASVDDLEIIPWLGLKADSSLFVDAGLYEGLDSALKDSEVRTYDESSTPNTLLYRARSITIPYYDGRKLDAMIRIYPMMLGALYNDYIARLNESLSAITVTPGVVSSPPMSVVIFSAIGGSGVFDWAIEDAGGAGAEIKNTVARKLSKTGKSTCKVYTGIGTGTIRIVATDRQTKMRGYASLSIGSVSSWDVSGEIQ